VLYENLDRPDKWVVVQVLSDFDQELKPLYDVVRGFVLDPPLGHLIHVDDEDASLAVVPRSTAAEFSLGEDLLDS
jgi:hypothetical protein